MNPRDYPLFAEAVTGKPDYRRKEAREAEVLAQLEIDNGLSVAWLQENRQRPAAVERLIARGVLHRLPCKHPSVMRFEREPVPSLFRRIVEWATGVQHG